MKRINVAPSSRLMLALLLGFAFGQLPTMAQSDDRLVVALPDEGLPPLPKVGQENALPSVAAAEQTTGEVSVASDVTSFDESIASAIASVDSVRKLSVEPGTRPLMPADTPAWVTAAPDVRSSTHRFTVGSLPTSNYDEAEGALDEPLLVAFYDYVDSQLIQQPGASEKLRRKLSVNYIRRNLVEDPAGFVAELTTSNGPMYQKWVIVSVTAEQRSQIEGWYREAIQRDRLTPIGLGLVAVISFVGLSHMVLRRAYGLPKTTAVNAQHLASLPTSNNPPPRKRGSLFWLLASVMLLACGFVLIVGLLGARFTKRAIVREPSAENHPIVRLEAAGLRSELTNLPALPGMNSMPEMPAMPPMTVELSPVAFE